MFNRHPLLYETVEAMQAEIVIDNPELGTVTKIAEVLPNNAKVSHLCLGSCDVQHFV